MLAPKLWDALREQIRLADSVTSLNPSLRLTCTAKPLKSLSELNVIFYVLPGTLFIYGIFCFIIVKTKKIKPVIQLFLDIYFCLVVLLSFFLSVKHFVALCRKALHK